MSLAKPPENEWDKDLKTRPALFSADHDDAIHKLQDGATLTPILRHRNSAERKLEPVQKGVMAYFPDALAATARISRIGNDKHNPGEPLHWSREKSSDHLDCAARHLLSPEVVEDGETHLANAAWRVLAALQLQEEKRLVAAGIMPLSGLVTTAE